MPSQIYHFALLIQIENFSHFFITVVHLCPVNKCKDVTNNLQVLGSQPNATEGEFYLDMANWNLQEAVSAWMDVHHPRNNPLAMRFIQVLCLYTSYMRNIAVILLLKCFKNMSTHAKAVSYTHLTLPTIYSV